MNTDRVTNAANVLTPKWTVALICALLDGPKGYAELESAVPDIPQPTLSSRVRQLEANGIIERTVYSTRPITVKYDLTPTGRDLEVVFEAIDEWARAVKKKRKKTA